MSYRLPSNLWQAEASTSYSTGLQDRLYSAGSQGPLLTAGMAMMHRAISSQPAVCLHLFRPTRQLKEYAISVCGQNIQIQPTFSIQIRPPSEAVCGDQHAKRSPSSQVSFFVGCCGRLGHTNHSPLQQHLRGSNARMCHVSAAAAVAAPERTPQIVKQPRKQSSRPFDFGDYDGDATAQNTGMAVTWLGTSSGATSNCQQAT